MDNKFAKSSETHVDSGASEQSVSNSRTPPMVPEEEVELLDFPRYDMTGEKILIIVNQRTFMRTKHFGRKKPSYRKGTNEDRDRLKELFKKLGYRVIVLHNLQYLSIIEKLTAIANADHTRTSCICVAILTKGDQGGQICAKDRLYSLSEVMDIFANVTSLIGKPKIYFVQACRGTTRDAGQTVRVGRHSDRIHPKHTSHVPSSQDLLKRDADSADHVAIISPSKKALTLPSYADYLVLYSCVEDYKSHRNISGSWMIQSLCRQIEDFHKKEDILHIIRRVKYEVSLKATIHELPEKNNKKQQPMSIDSLRKAFDF